MATSEIRAEISHIEGEIELHAEALRSRTEKLAFLQQQLRDAATDSCDTNTLPDDIISEIFLRCMPPTLRSYCKRQHPRHSKTADVPVILSLVCQRWCKVARGTPRLWTDVSVTVRARGQVETGPALEHAPAMFALYVERAGACPLCVKIGCPCCCGTETRDLGPLAVALAQHAYSIGHLDLGLSAKDAMALQQLTGAQDYPVLRELRLKFKFSTDEETSSLSSLRLFGVLPALCRLTLKSPPPQITALDLPWPSLTRFKGRRISPDAILALLRIAPNLTDADIETSSHLGSDTITVVHLRLQNLTLRDKSRKQRNMSCGYVLKLLTLPDLRSLVLNDTDWRVDALPPSEMHAFFRGLSSSLERLSLPGAWTSADKRNPRAWSTNPFTGVLSNLAHLTFTNASLEVMNQFSDDLGRAEYLPSLESLTILSPDNRPNSDDPGIAPSHVLEHLRSRLATKLRRGSKMRRVDIFMHGYLDEIAPAHGFKELVKRSGLELRLFANDGKHSKVQLV